MDCICTEYVVYINNIFKKESWSDSTFVSFIFVFGWLSLPPSIPNNTISKN